jgi:ribosomal protein S18 acetylase RimI-like enzyme
MAGVVRRAILADAAAIASIHVRGWQSAYQGIIPDSYLAALSIDDRTRTWGESIAAGATPDGGTIFVAESDNAVLGWMTCGPSRDASAPAGTGELHGIYIDPLTWGHGIGTALMESCLEELRSRGFVRATLWVLTENVAARRWYENRGWSRDGTEASFEIAGSELSELRYARET